MTWPVVLICSAVILLSGFLFARRRRRLHEREMEELDRALEREYQEAQRLISQAEAGRRRVNFAASLRPAPTPLPPPKRVPAQYTKPYSAASNGSSLLPPPTSFDFGSSSAASGAEPSPSDTGSGSGGDTDGGGGSYSGGGASGEW